MKKRVSRVQDDLKRKQLEDQFTTADERSRTRSGPPRIREDVVGLDGEVELLLNEEIFKRTKKVSILYILGMGGIGKTTLASLLYNHAAVAPRFEIRAWVNVSPALTAEDILMELIRQLPMDDEPETTMMESNKDVLLRIVLRRLLGRTYFIVFDNVWSGNQLDSLIDAFPRAGNDKRKLVITSRKNDIIRSYLDYIHEMKILDNSKSWELFLKKVFGSDRKCPNHLERIGRQIVRKCDGLPLAIQEAGANLSEKTQSESVWEDFLETMDLSKTSASLELSYHSLSEKLKSCFSSLAFFKEGTTMRVDKMIQVWIAGGMVSQKDEVTARWDLNALISQYFVQVRDTRNDSSLKNCHVNHNLHRLAVKKAKEDLMFEVITNDESNYQSCCKPRHRVICFSREKLSYSTNEDKHLVSLFFRGGGNFDANPSYWRSFDSLQILDFEDFGLKTLPEIVGTLNTLKYLGLRSNFLQELPLSLGRLRKLQVLDIALNFMLEVPNIIWKMGSLRHLYMSDIICREPLKIEKLYNLQTLTYISVDKWTFELSELRMMINLRKLGIEEVDRNTCVRKLFASLAELKRLEHLILRGFRFKSMPELHELHILRGLKQLKLDGLITRLPSANNFPPNIEYLSLSNSCLDEDPMPILEKLSKLRYLKLRNAFIGEQMMISRHGFSKLCTVCLEELCHLRSVKVGKGAMPWIELLEIKNCPYLKTVPKEIRSIQASMQLKIMTTKVIAAKMRESSIISKKRYVDIQP